MGKAITVVASYTDAQNTAESVSSNATSNVINVNDLPTGSVTITNSTNATRGTTTLQQNDVLTVADTLADVDGKGAVTYTWKAGATTLGTGTSYTLTQADVGKAITVVASYTDAQNTAESVSSSATGTVANMNALAVWQTSALSGVTNFDVASNLVFKSDQALKVGTGSIRILDENAAFSRTGFHNDINDNDQVIDVTTALANGLISLSADKKTITINPKWDLDLSSNYKIIIDEGAFVSETGGLKASALEVSFATVTPGTHSSGTMDTEAVLSRKMSDNGTLADSKYWFDVEQIGLSNSTIIQLGDLTGKDYVLAAKNYQEIAPILEEFDDGLDTAPFQVGFFNFGNGDAIYFDNQLNNSVQQFLPDNLVPQNSIRTSIGADINQTILQFSKSAIFTNGSALPVIALSFEGSTDNTRYEAIYTNTFEGITYNGFADKFLNNPDAVIAG